MGNQQPDFSKTPLFVWMSLGSSVVGGMIGFLAAQYITFQELDLKTRKLDLKTRATQLSFTERDDRIHLAKLEIIKHVKDTNFKLADAVLIYLLKPIEPDETRF